MEMIVCVKQILDPEAPPATFKLDPATNKAVPPPGIPPVISPFDEQATEAALRIKDAHGGTIRVISMGTGLLRDVVKKPLSMGADELYLIEDAALTDLDAYGTAYALAAAIKKIGKYDLIFCGRQAADWDRGQVGSGIAEILGMPCITVAKKVEVIDGKVRVERVVADGYEIIESTTPCLITVSNELGEPRYPTMRGIMAAGRKPLTVWTAKDIGVDPAQIKARTRLLKAFVPQIVSKCEIIEGETLEEAGAKLALRLREAKII